MECHTSICNLENMWQKWNVAVTSQRKPGLHIAERKVDILKQSMAPRSKSHRYSSAK